VGFGVFRVDGGGSGNGFNAEHDRFIHYYGDELVSFLQDLFFFLCLDELRNFLLILESVVGVDDFLSSFNEFFLVSREFP
jgi:hypothetical protein